jgi:hypothetical protein
MAVGECRHEKPRNHHAPSTILSHAMKSEIVIISRIIIISIINSHHRRRRPSIFHILLL